MLHVHVTRGNWMNVQHFVVVMCRMNSDGFEFVWQVVASNCIKTCMSHVTHRGNVSLWQDLKLFYFHSLLNWGRYRAPKDGGHFWSSNQDSDRIFSQDWFGRWFICLDERGVETLTIFCRSFIVVVQHQNCLPCILVRLFALHPGEPIGSNYIL